MLESMRMRWAICFILPLLPVAMVTAQPAVPVVQFEEEAGFFLAPRRGR